MNLKEKEHDDGLRDTCFWEEDVKESVLDLYKYDEYINERIINGKSAKAKEIHLYFKTKYNIRLFETDEDEVHKIIFGDFEEWV